MCIILQELGAKYELRLYIHHSHSRRVIREYASIFDSSTRGSLHNISPTCEHGCIPYRPYMHAHIIHTLYMHAYIYIYAFFYFIYQQLCMVGFCLCVSFI